jgi:hypothetical protein
VPLAVLEAAVPETVPVAVTVKGKGGAALVGVNTEVVSVMTLAPAPVTEEGLKLAVTPGGRFEAAKPTADENPFTGTTLTVYCALLPTLIGLWGACVIVIE